MNDIKIVQVDSNACTGCGVCVAMCPARILILDADSGKCVVSDQSKCDRLAGCEAACPVNAIKIN